MLQSRCIVGGFFISFAVAACAESANDSAPTEPGKTDEIQTQPEPSKPKECKSKADCPSGWTCPLTGAGEFVRGVCTPPKQTKPQDPTFSYGAWTEWSACNAACGGTQTRTRECTKDGDETTAPCASCGGICSESQECEPCVTPTDCKVSPWGVVADGYSGTAYKAAAPTGACESEVRTCTNGTLSGSFGATSCRAGCTGTPWGSVSDGFSKKAYKNATASSLAECEATAETRACSNGTMSGTNTSLTCTVPKKPCELAGAKFQRWTGIFDKNTHPSGWNECMEDGSWFHHDTGNPLFSGQPCPWGGAFAETNACGWLDGVPYRCTRDGTWQPGTTCLPL